LAKKGGGAGERIGRVFSRRTGRYRGGVIESKNRKFQGRLFGQRLKTPKTDKGLEPRFFFFGGRAIRPYFSTRGGHWENFGPEFSFSGAVANKNFGGGTFPGGQGHQTNRRGGGGRGGFGKTGGEETFWPRWGEGAPGPGAPGPGKIWGGGGLGGPLSYRDGVILGKKHLSIGGGGAEFQKKHERRAALHPSGFRGCDSGGGENGRRGAKTQNMQKPKNGTTNNKNQQRGQLQKKT